MDISIILIKQIITMVCMVMVGVILGKTKVIGGEESRVLSQALIYAFSPCAFLSAFQGEFTPDKAQGLLIAAAGATVTMALFVAFGELLHRRADISTAEQCCMGFSNAGNIVIPIVQGIWGTEYVIFVCPYILIQNLLIWTYGIRLMGGERKPLWKMLLNPNIICLLVGLTMFFANIRLPAPIQQGIGNVGNCLGPVAMIVIGILLSQTPLMTLARDKRILRTVALRLVVFPLVAVAVAAVIGLWYRGGESQIILMILLLSSLGPSASNLTSIAQTLHHPQTQLVSAVNALSVVLCAVTMPLQCMLLQALLPR